MSRSCYKLYEYVQYPSPLFGLAPSGAGKMSRMSQLSNCQPATRGTFSPTNSETDVRCNFNSDSPSLQLHGDRSVSAAAPRMNEIPFPLSLSRTLAFFVFFSLLVFVGTCADLDEWLPVSIPRAKNSHHHPTYFSFLLSVSLITYQRYYYFTLP